ncbi:SecDF P1 head subdomain-containing protein [Rhizohabitans arisaemae]|uniref:SecDF P1 head subdomain-containing protein n=1 Tax=Rhizohabitans arisaemae TaxID=2720610 RepID=UPI0024B071EA|nr:hypothetical protein [Rhizohabitans arisaemae]
MHANTPGGVEGPPPGGRNVPGTPGPAPDGTAAPSQGEAAAPKAVGGLVTVVLGVALVLAVLLAAFIGFVAYRMAVAPGEPIVGSRPLTRLTTPINVLPVTASYPAPCSGVGAYPDDLGRTCYQTADPGMPLTQVQKIEALKEGDDKYSVRITLAPANRDQIARLTSVTPNEKKLAIIVADRVVAAPTIAEKITGTSFRIGGGYTKAEADALVAKLVGQTPGTGQIPEPGVPQTGYPQTFAPTPPVPGFTTPPPTGLPNGVPGQGGVPGGITPSGVGGTPSGPNGAGTQGVSGRFATPTPSCTPSPATGICPP